MIEKLKDMISKREKADDLTTRFQQISISQHLKQQLDSDDDDEDISISYSKMDIESKDVTSSKADYSNDLSKTKSVVSSTTNKQKKDNWSYDSAVTYATKPQFEVKCF